MIHSDTNHLPAEENGEKMLKIGSEINKAEKCKAISRALSSELGQKCTLKGQIPCWKYRFDESPVTKNQRKIRPKSYSFNMCELQSSDIISARRQSPIQVLLLLCSPLLLNFSEEIGTHHATPIITKVR